MTGFLKRLPVLAISLALAGWVIARTDWPQLGELFANRLQLGWLPIFALTAPLLTLVSAWKWRSLLAARGQRDGLLPLTGLYVTGQFYSNVLPSSSGGDVVRAELARRRHGSQAHTPPQNTPTRSTVYAAITAERFTGLFVLLLLALGALATTPALWQRGALAGLALSGVAFASAVMAAVASRRVGRGAAKLGQRLPPLARPAAKLQAFQADLWAYAQHRRVLGIALLQSIAFYALAALSVSVAGACFGITVDARSATTVTALVLVITLLPISINGVGLWEFAFSETFDLLGYGREFGLALALIIRFRDVAWSTTGFLLATTLMKKTSDPNPDAQRVEEPHGAESDKNQRPDA